MQATIAATSRRCPRLNSEAVVYLGKINMALCSAVDVRFGSKADICAATSHVRFTPNSDRESGYLRFVMSALPPCVDVYGPRPIATGRRDQVQWSQLLTYIRLPAGCCKAALSVRVPRQAKTTVTTAGP
jgi:hypothetical protein